MTPRMPRPSVDELIRAIKKAGFELIDQEGSHQKWRHPVTGKQTIIPYHKGETIRPKLLNSILNGAGVTIEDLMKLLKK
jgi:predicted RNA binding protein YcfA (HicA-like mRNA interferase family)